MATIRKRGSGYQIRVSCGYDSTGAQITKTMTYTPLPGMTEKQIKKELQRQATLFEEKCHNGLYLGGNIRLSDFCDIWFRDYAEKQLKAKTLERYREISARVNAALGHIRIEKLQPHHLIAFYQNLSEENIRLDGKYRCSKQIEPIITDKGYTKTSFCKASGVSYTTLKDVISGKNVSPSTAKKIETALSVKNLFVPADGKKRLSNKTIKNHHLFISSMLSTAVEWQIIPYNPCQRVKPPKTERKEAAYIDELQAKELLAALRNEPLPFKTSVTLLLFSGMRRGELLGLEWSDVDFKNALVNINKESVYVKGRGTFDDTPKNKSSERVVKLPDNCISLLKEHRTQQNKTRLLMGDQWQDSGKIFTQNNGKPMHPDTLSSQFKAFVQKNGFPDIHLHTLRHTNASLLIAAGTDIRTVAKRLGHATASTTSMIYAHAIKAADEIAAEKLNNILKIKE